MKKTPKAVVQQRIDEVQHLRNAGASPQDVVDHAKAQGWGVSERQLRAYTKRADEQAEVLMMRRLDRITGRHIAQRRKIYATALKAGDLRAALAALRDEAELLGLYPKDDDTFRRMTDEELAEAFEDGSEQGKGTDDA